MVRSGLPAGRVDLCIDLYLHASVVPVTGRPGLIPGSGPVGMPPHAARFNAEVQDEWLARWWIGP